MTSSLDEAVLRLFESIEHSKRSKGGEFLRYCGATSVGRRLYCTII